MSAYEADIHMHDQSLAIGYVYCTFTVRLALQVCGDVCVYFRTDDVISLSVI